MSENDFQNLVDLMARLRGPGGCPWDHEQTRETLKPMLIEEAFELLEALDSEEAEKICEELGDLLFQVVFHSQIAKEKEEFDVYDVCRRVHEKMVRRHPHVFGDRSFVDSQELLRNWEDLKAAEKAASGRPQPVRKSVLDGIPERLPALYQSHQLTSKAARVGFDWPDLDGIHLQYQEEFKELKLALETGDEKDVKEEVGTSSLPSSTWPVFSRLIPRQRYVEPTASSSAGSNEWSGTSKADNNLSRKSHPPKWRTSGKIARTPRGQSRDLAG